MASSVKATLSNISRRFEKIKSTLPHRHLLMKQIVPSVGSVWDWIWRGNALDCGRTDYAGLLQESKLPGGGWGWTADVQGKTWCMSYDCDIWITCVAVEEQVGKFSSRAWDVVYVLWPNILVMCLAVLERVGEVVSTAWDLVYALWTWCMGNVYGRWGTSRRIWLSLNQRNASLNYFWRELVTLKRI